jgi:hypothetical protein
MQSWVMNAPIMKQMHAELRSTAWIELDDSIWKEIIRHTEELKATKGP